MNKIELYEKSRHTSTGITIVPAGEPSIFPLHWHEHIEFQFILRGSLTVRCGAQTLELKKHDCLIINANELHEGIGEEDCECFKFKLHPTFFDQKHYIFNNIVRDTVTSSLIFKIIELAQSTDDADVYTLKGYIFHLIGHLCKTHAAKAITPTAIEEKSEKSQKMNLIATYLHSNYAAKISAETLAEMSHYTYSYFSCAFKEVFGVPVTKYLLDIRINKATTLLRLTDMNVTEIAASCGFSDTNYFARAFKKETGCSPSEYRRQVHGNA